MRQHAQARTSRTSTAQAAQNRQNPGSKISAHQRHRLVSAETAAGARHSAGPGGVCASSLVETYLYPPTAYPYNIFSHFLAQSASDS
eukprot:1310968-Prymnesium_polylepis.1